MSDKNPSVDELVDGWSDTVLTQEYLLFATATNRHAFTQDVQASVTDLLAVARNELSRRGLLGDVVRTNHLDQMERAATRRELNVEKRAEKATRRART